MRIRNSRPPFRIPSPPNPLSRSRCHLRGSLLSGDPFLVEDTSRLMGWSCYPLKHPACQAVVERSGGELQKVVADEINSKKLGDKDKGRYHSVLENSSKVMGGNHGRQGNGAKGLYLSTADHGYRNASGTRVNFSTTLPSAPSQMGETEEELQFKRRKLACHLEKEMEKDAQEDGSSVEKMEMPKNSKQEPAKEETSNKKTRTVYCVMKCEFFIPSDDDRSGGDGAHEEMALEETVSRLNEMVERGFEGSNESGGYNSLTFAQMSGRGHKGNNESGDCNRFTEFKEKQIKKVGRPRKIKDVTAGRIDGNGEVQKRKRGRPRKI